MKVLFARFERAPAADAAIAELRQDPVAADRVRMSVHRDLDRGALHEEVQHSGKFVETDARHGVVIGLAVGLVVGPALGGTLFGVFGLPGGVAVGIAFGLVAGLFVGGILSGLVGTGLTDRNLRRLARDLGEDEVIVTLEIEDDGAVESVERILVAHGGRYAEKRLIS